MSDSVKKIEPKTIRVIAVDPGYDRFGVAIMEKVPDSKEKLIFSDCKETSPKESFLTRLEQVISFFQETIKKFSPDFFAIETLFFSANKTTAMHIAEVRGALLITARQAGLKVMELNPMQIKLAVTGDGKSDKSQMIKMVQLITGIQKKARDDEYDAISAAIAFHALYRPGVSALD